jgi:hypothetical protein
MWSLTKPIGEIAMAPTPSPGSCSMRSQMSGSSHGCEAGPERDW